MNWKFVICHYSEIGLKGNNRGFFENQLVENIKKSIKPSFYKNIKRIYGRILIELKEEAKEEEITNSLKNIFGLANFSFAIDTKPNIEAIEKESLKLLKNKKFKTFKIFSQRSRKDFPLTSPEINKKVGEFILKNLKNKKVDLENPEATCFIEVVDNYIFLYPEKIKGPGGLPVGISGKAVSLLSGGIDSPVASFYGMKRGIKIIFLHFYVYPYANKASIEKTRKILKVLKKYQFESKIYFVPFSDVQKEILLKTKEKFRVIFYRRFMIRIAEIIAKKEKAKALLTGENIGQVASQTLENIGAIEEVTKFPILRPLITQDKEEIIKKAKEIETYEISILPHQDCCARFLPEHPETRAKLEELLEEEKKLDSKKIINAIINKITFEII